MIELLLAAALLLRDPPGDAVGAGGLVPPSAEQYRNVGSFDLLEVQILESSMLALTIEMGALPNPAGLANGFSNAVIDVYVDLGEGGSEALLPGPEMRMPPGRGWEVALRITGDGATAYRSNDDPTASGPSVSYPVRVQADERVIRVETPFERPEIEGVYALTGVYDPFVASGWRPLAETPSPWAFASEEQRRPVIDLLASDEVAQAEAIRTGVLPMPRNRTAGAMWMLLMAVGVLVAGVGLVLRRMVVPPARAPSGGPVGSEPGTRGVEREPPSEYGDGPAQEPLPPTVPAVTLPTFLPALPPPASGERGSGRAGASHVPEAIGEPGTWLDEDPEEDPEARTWRGDPPDVADARREERGRPTQHDTSEQPAAPERADAGDEPTPARGAGTPAPRDGGDRTEN